MEKYGMSATSNWRLRMVCVRDSANRIHGAWAQGPGKVKRVARTEKRKENLRGPLGHYDAGCEMVRDLKISRAMNRKRTAARVCVLQHRRQLERPLRELEWVEVRSERQLARQRLEQ